MPKRLAILGSTGSIGTSTLDVVRRLPGEFEVVALTAFRDGEKLAAQAAEFKPRYVVLADESAPAPALPAGCRLLRGAGALPEIASADDVDIVLLAVVGSAGLPAALAAVSAGKRLALANKESLVCGGMLVMPAAEANGAEVLPVDSEHSALWQSLLAGRINEVERMILTASGGPFRTWPADKIETATPEDALAHPTWTMGAKVTIDCASLMNKGLEAIEAHWLFGLPAEKIDVVVHPQSLVHSLVEFVDGSTITQMSVPDMRTPIQYALTYPRRLPGPGQRLPAGRGQRPLDLRFEPPDTERFPALELAYDVIRRGGTAGAVLNAADEVAVEAFRQRKISFGGISRLVGCVMEEASVVPVHDLDDVIQADAEARRRAGELILNLRL